ncbi:glycosyltransferase family 90 protein [Lentinula guzmanii]|uniref:Glycosyltransferase family 90 protein n=1 Tax=Lentinula guzmanii TaxID=2804957 RepID=A0AA38J844_9AGAR|nr:glycosyltransferase family 90 protein [Lentinula guzmanii]
MSLAEQRFRTKLSRQSKTLAAAVAEYQRRYAMPPPKGFDKWWEFTQQYEVIMIDEYDGLMRDLQPFYDLKGGGVEIRRRIAAVAGLASIDLVRVRGGVLSTISVQADGYVDSEVSARAKGLKSILGRFAKDLPDMDFPVNAKAEGRVIVPWEKRLMQFNSTTDNNTHMQPLASFRPDWKGEGNVWDAWRRTCPPDSTARKLFSSIRSGMHILSSLTSPQFTFSPNTPYHDQSFCDEPHLHYMQGHFFSDWRTLGELYPVMSPARASGFADIKIPSHYYYGSTSRYTYGWDAEKGEIMDVDKDELNKIFWRGATTGGGNEPAGFAGMYQRHRASSLTLLTFSPKLGALGNSGADVDASGGLRHLSISYATLNKEIMDIAFMKATNPAQYPGGLENLMKDHRFAEGIPLGGHWKYKYLLDLDGMSYSGRFMAFLASDSVPVKSTVYEEFYGEWIEPWLHYIPLSAGYEEIYNIYSYFSGISSEVVEQVYDASGDLESAGNSSSTRTIKHIPGAPDGDAKLHRIALAGKQWKRTIGRKLDMEAYVYRLALEWARLCSDDREEMSMNNN